MNLQSQSKFLRAAAEEIRKEGHAGWGNTCEQAADAIDALLRERESAKAAVTDEMVATFVEKVAVILSGAPFPSARSYAKAREISDLMLEAVAPMLASARVPDETGWLIESAFNGFSPSWWGGVPEGCGQSFTANPNKAVRFCRKDDAEAVAKHMHMVIVTEHKWLAAAPKPETEE